MNKRIVAIVIVCHSYPHTHTHCKNTANRSRKTYLIVWRRSSVQRPYYCVHVRQVLPSAVAGVVLLCVCAPYVTLWCGRRSIIVCLCALCYPLLWQAQFYCVSVRLVLPSAVAGAVLLCACAPCVTLCCGRRSFIVCLWALCYPLLWQAQYYCVHVRLVLPSAVAGAVLLCVCAPCVTLCCGYIMFELWCLNCNIWTVMFEL